MKIAVTKKEYKLLLDMLTIADWVMHSHCVPGDERYKAHDAFKHKMYSYYKEMAAEDSISHSKSDGEYYTEDAYMEYIFETFMEPFEQDTFWDELIHKLGERDALEKHGESSLREMEGILRLRAIEEAKSRYEKEFDESGLKNLKIISD